MFLTEKLASKVSAAWAGGRLHRMAFPILAASAIFGASVTTAAALNSREAQAVVLVLEQLVEETGNPVVYDEEAADDWFERDDESAQRISAAGFTRADWKEAFDQTMMGFIASVPQSELDQISASFEQKVGSMPQLNAEQKEEAIDAWRSKFAELKEIRQQGGQYASVVAPYSARLRKISLER